MKVVNKLYEKRAEVLKPLSLTISKDEVEQDEILALLYAPDSTGLPDCSLGYVMSDKAKPEFKKYVSEHLFIPSSTVPSHGSSDADTALDLIVPFDMQLGHSREMVGNYYLNMIKKAINTDKDD